MAWQVCCTLLEISGCPYLSKNGDEASQRGHSTEYGDRVHVKHTFTQL